MIRSTLKFLKCCTHLDIAPSYVHRTYSLFHGPGLPYQVLTFVSLEAIKTHRLSYVMILKLHNTFQGLDKSLILATLGKKKLF